MESLDYLFNSTGKYVIGLASSPQLMIWATIYSCFVYKFRRAASVSIDDFYLTFSEQVSPITLDIGNWLTSFMFLFWLHQTALARSFPENKLLEVRDKPLHDAAIFCGMNYNDFSSIPSFSINSLKLRGNAGSHDLGLGIQTLSALKSLTLSCE